MDPQAAWTNLLDAYETHDWEAAYKAANALRDWIVRGGFPPRTLDRQMTDAWHRVVTLAACAFVSAESPQHGGSD